MTLQSFEGCDRGSSWMGMQAQAGQSLRDHVLSVWTNERMNESKTQLECGSGKMICYIDGR